MLQALVESCRALPAVPRDAAIAYGAAADALVDMVNAELEADPRIAELLGTAPRDLTRDAHSNHAALMAAVCRLNSCELLARTVPWIYGTYHARDFSYGYFPLELAAWKRAVEERLPPAPTSEILAVYDWMLAQHETMIRLSVSREGPDFPAQGETGEMQETLLALLLDGDRNGSLRLAAQSGYTATEISRFYLDVVCPVMYRIGDLWQRSEISVAEEHRAMAIAARVTAMLYPRLTPTAAPRGKAVVAAAPGELHELGARMAADFLEIEGWEVTYLGADTPVQELLDMLRRQRPFMAALSVATVFNLARAREAVAMIKGDRETANIKVMVGGYAFNFVPELCRDFGADGCALDARQGTLIANEWWAERRP